MNLKLDFQIKYIEQLCIYELQISAKSNSYKLLTYSTKMDY